MAAKQGKTTPAAAVADEERLFFEPIEQYANRLWRDKADSQDVGADMREVTKGMLDAYLKKTAPMFINMDDYLRDVLPLVNYTQEAEVLSFGQMTFTGLDPAAFHLTLDRLMDTGPALTNAQAMTQTFLCYLFFPDRLKELNPVWKWSGLAYSVRNFGINGTALLRNYDVWHKDGVTFAVRLALQRWFDELDLPLTMFHDAHSFFWRRFWQVKSKARESAWRTAFGCGENCSCSKTHPVGAEMIVLDDSDADFDPSIQLKLRGDEPQVEVSGSQPYLVGTIRTVHISSRGFV